ncbi:MAG TPA: hypothetical protein VIK91_13045 [Nannocystis sp.]
MRELFHAVVWWARVVTDGATVAALYRTLREIGHRRRTALWGGIVLHWRAARYSWALQRTMDAEIEAAL